jgi:hypothetical protein
MRMRNLNVKPRICPFSPFELCVLRAYLVRVDHEYLCLSCWPGTFIVIHRRDAQVLVSRTDTAAQLLHVLIQDPVNTTYSSCDDTESQRTHHITLNHNILIMEH